MDALQRINQALAYIEANLEEEIDYRQIETIALCSEYHFRRLFSLTFDVNFCRFIYGHAPLFLHSTLIFSIDNCSF